ncbi:hypothetical protein Tco_0088647 [Tanacetum coccineum]
MGRSDALQEGCGGGRRFEQPAGTEAAPRRGSRTGRVTFTPRGEAPDDQPARPVGSGHRPARFPAPAAKGVKAHDTRAETHMPCAREAAPDRGEQGAPRDRKASSTVDAAGHARHSGATARPETQRGPKHPDDDNGRSREDQRHAQGHGEGRRADDTPSGASENTSPGPSRGGGGRTEEETPADKTHTQQREQEEKAEQTRGRLPATDGKYRKGRAKARGEATPERHSEGRVRRPRTRARVTPTTVKPAKPSPENEEGTSRSGVNVGKTRDDETGTAPGFRVPGDAGERQTGTSDTEQSAAQRREAGPPTKEENKRTTARRGPEGGGRHSEAAAPVTRPGIGEGRSVGQSRPEGRRARRKNKKHEKGEAQGKESSREAAGAEWFATRRISGGRKQDTTRSGGGRETKQGSRVKRKRQRAAGRDNIHGEASTDGGRTPRAVPAFQKRHAPPDAKQQDEGGAARARRGRPGDAADPEIRAHQRHPPRERPTERPRHAAQ